jgi:soluble cytochrome b562
MNTLKKLYKEFFGLKEQAPASNIPKFTADDVENAKEMAAALKDMQSSLKMESDLEEAQLINRITDYRGGIEYVLRNPNEAQAVAQEIKEWAEKKGFTVVKHTISPSGKIGYFYFRLGTDPGLESQKLQGYLAQKPELKHFRFNVRQQKPKVPQPEI